MKSGNLSERCAASFDPRARERGVVYARTGRVRAIEIRSGDFTGEVRGTERYGVLLAAGAAQRGETELHVWCDCPRFESGHYCKHLYAVLLWLDDTGEDLGLPRTARIRLSQEPPGGRDDADDGIDQPPKPAPGRIELPGWLRRLPSDSQRAQRPHARELLYVISPAEILRSGRVGVRVWQRTRTRDGSWAAARPTSIDSALVQDEPDRSALLALAACPGAYAYAYGYRDGVVAERGLPAGLQPLVLPLLARTGRLCEMTEDGPRTLAFDETPAALRLRVARAAREPYLTLSAELRASGAHAPEAVRLVIEGGFALVDDTLLRFADPASLELVAGFARGGALELAEPALPRVLERLAEGGLPAIDGLAELGWVDSVGAPSGLLRILRPIPYAPQSLFYAELFAEYGAARVRVRAGGAAVFDGGQRRIVRRSERREAELAAELIDAGCAPLPLTTDPSAGDVQLQRKRMPEIVAALLARGWRVDAQGVPVRSAGAARLAVRSTIDWFEVEATIAFGDVSATLPELLAAAARGERTIALGDGSVGLLPEEWLARVAPLAGLGETSETGVRFQRQQALLLEALLAGQPQVDADAAFRDACERLTRAGEPRPRSAPPGFAGELRSYQRDGLGWLHYLGEAGLGACLADDMGLGKTVQVLALLALRAREEPAAEERCASLVVAPSSVVPNWLAEAARFAPSLRVLDFTGAGRGALRDKIAAHDLVVTSYGTLRAEIEKLAGERFHTVVLDEAQAIKNAGSKTAKAARLLRAERRIALSGTPVENHLGELWSLFDFLNPGLLGASAHAAKVLEDLTGDGVAALARAVRPFILRRTKDQVLRELPAKTEQTLVCELSAAERRRYDELRKHYQARVRKAVDAQGLARSKIHVLEALLRLRQAACHAGLIEQRLAHEPSAKLTLLLEQLDETLAEGHKALVFSQFTSLLAILRAQLDAKGVAYEYLDGRTRDRAARVARFQQDERCKLFLVSLKAGGLGLNLTAADYVFLLDPWWNPAVEAQAVDRAHRIGQTRPVFAYRLVAKDTIEEKILTLQANKRKLADAVISADASVLRSLTREDLELLLG